MTTALQGLLDRLARLLDAANVPFIIAGSFASSAHGLPRTHSGLDIVVDPPSAEALDALIGTMSPDDYYVDADAARDALRRRSMFNVIDHASGWKVDFIVRKNRAFRREEIGRRMKIALLDVAVFVASPEDTIVAKLEWSKQSGGSERQRRDVAGIVKTVGPQLERAYVERWGPRSRFGGRVGRGTASVDLRSPPKNGRAVAKRRDLVLGDRSRRTRGVIAVRTTTGALAVDVGSGSYDFVAN
jgi:hypothetical protein